MKYRIVKEIEARNVMEALKNDKKGEIMFIEIVKEEINEEQEKQIGFCS